MAKSLYRYWCQYCAVTADGATFFNAMGIERDGPMTDMADVASVVAHIRAELQGQMVANGQPIEFLVNLLGWTKFDEGSALLLPNGRPN